MSINIRHERIEDQNAVRELNEMAFGRRGEAEAVDVLRQSDEFTISLVAEQGGQVVGHIFFSPVVLETGGDSFSTLALGPMAVRPSLQRQGIGSLLVKAGLDECLNAGFDVIVVLGHPGFYPRFGFVPSQPLGVRWQKDVPEEVFMLAELRPGALAGRKGTVKYHPAFDEL